MSDARGRILDAVRRARRGQASDPATIAADAAALLDGIDGLRPGLGQLAADRRFIERVTSERLTGTVAEVANAAGIPSAVAAWLDGRGLPHAAAMPPDPRLRGLDWAGFTLRDGIAADEPVTVTHAEFGIAETGSLVIRSGPETPQLFNYLPLHHVAVVRRQTILGHLDDLWPRLATDGRLDARLIGLVTGTSGTADIEAINVRGAHGPRFLHVVVVG